MNTPRSEMRRVLLTTDSVGGVWTYTLALAEGLAARGCLCTAAVLGPPPSTAQRMASRKSGLRLMETGLPLDWTAASPSDHARTASRLTEIATAADADIVHLHTPAFAAYRWPAPVVAVAHSCVATWWDAVHGDTMPPDLQWRADAVARGLRAADAVIAPSAAFADYIRTVYSFPGKIEIVHNGTGWRAPQSACDRAGVLCAGRLWDAGKNMATLDTAAGMLRHVVSAAGPCDGADGSRFTPAHLRHLGTLGEAELATAYSSAALFAGPSLYEPFGLAVLEAARCGTPLLLADIPTFRELWDGAAMFVPARDALAWANSIDALLNDRAKLVAFGTLARSRAAHFTQDRMAAATSLIHDIACNSALAAA